MPTNYTDLSTRDPFEMHKRAEETNGEYVRVEVTLHPIQTSAKSTTSLAHQPWIVDGIGEHFHPTQEEYFKVVVGALHIVLDGKERTLTADEDITLPAHVPHLHWNPADQPARIQIEHRPARQSDALLETLYTLAQAGHTDENGIPGCLQSMVLQQAYADHAYGTDRPIIVQKALATLIAPIGRLAGYKATYSGDEIEALK